MSDDLDDDVMDSEDSFDEFSQSSSLGGDLRNNPIVKIGVAVVALVVIVGVVFVFGGDSAKEGKSLLSGNVDVTSVPGEASTQAYEEAVKQKNADDFDEAFEKGGSSIPVPTESAGARLEVPAAREEVEDPLHRWRTLQEERIENEMQTKDLDAEPVTVLDAEQQSEAISNLAESMMQQMESILGSNSEDKEFITKVLIDYAAIDAGGGNSGEGNEGSEGEDGFVEDAEETVIIPAGKIVYGQFLLEANSDVPSVILVQMVSGPLKGWKLLGSFETSEDIEMLTVSFDIAVNENGDQYPVNAIMLDPDTSLAAKATDVNHRYFKRIVLPAAAAFIEGFAEAVSESGRTSVTVSGSGDGAVEEEGEKNDKQEVATGVTEAASEVGSILDDIADVPVQIIINAGTPIGVFFTENVVDIENGI